MIVVVATTVDRLAAARDAVGEAEVVAPTGDRRLLLLDVPDVATGHQVEAGLRKKGYPAVLRPGAGPQLAAWLHHTKPVTIGGRLTLSFVWSEHGRSNLPNLVEIDPAGGFGSAQHPATRLILDQLVVRISGGERVLDFGCGNGILGLSALRLGAARLAAVDIDPLAVESTRRNAALNGLEHLLDHRREGVFDVIVANIGRAALVELGPDLAARVAPNGWLVASGFSPPQCEVVAAALRPLAVMGQQTTGEWAALTLAAAPE